MFCTECQNELKVIGYKNVISGADSADEKTELYCVQTLECKNPNCKNCGEKVILTHPLNFVEN